VNAVTQVFLAESVIGVFGGFSSLMLSFLVPFLDGSNLWTCPVMLSNEFHSPAVGLASSSSSISSFANFSVSISSRGSVGLPRNLPFVGPTPLSDLTQFIFVGQLAAPCSYCRHSSSVSLLIFTSGSSRDLSEGVDLSDNLSSTTHSEAVFFFL